jgi:hypothetical protein
VCVRVYIRLLSFSINTTIRRRNVLMRVREIKGNACFYMEAGTRIQVAEDSNLGRGLRADSDFCLHECWHREKQNECIVGWETANRAA